MPSSKLKLLSTIKLVKKNSDKINSANYPHRQASLSSNTEEIDQKKNNNQKTKNP